MIVFYKERQCANCNASFTPRSPNQKYCSKECYTKVRREQTRIYHRSYKNKKRPSNEYERTRYRLKRIEETCAKKHDNCFSCPYEDCIQE